MKCKVCRNISLKVLWQAHEIESLSQNTTDDFAAKPSVLFCGKLWILCACCKTFSEILWQTLHFMCLPQNPHCDFAANLLCHPISSKTTSMNPFPAPPTGTIVGIFCKWVWLKMCFGLAYIVK